MSTVLPIPTAISRREAVWLGEQATGKRVLEIGSFLGFSTIVMAHSAEVVVAVDHHVGDWAHEDGTDTLEGFMENIRAAGVDGKVVPVVAKSEDVLPLLAPESFGLVFVDGNHDYENVERDAELSWPLLEPGGALVFHDYFDKKIERGWVRVQSAVDDFTKAQGRGNPGGRIPLAFGPDSLARIRKD